MNPIAAFNRHMLFALGAFVALVVMGSVFVGYVCFPAVAHEPLSFSCGLGLYSPLIAAVVAGLIYGRRVPVLLSPFIVVVPVVGLGLLLLRNYLHDWYGQDHATAIWLAFIYCLVPSVLASVLSALSSQRRPNAL